MTRLHHVNVVVPPGRTGDVVSFYELLGLRRVDKPTEGVAPTGAWFDVGDGTQVHLSEREGPVHPDQHSGLVVDDLERLVDDLLSRGATWTEQAPLDGARRGFTRDPVGNRVELIAAERAGGPPPPPPPGG